MRTSDFDYHLPTALIAQEPCETRDGSRLLVLERETGARADHHFHELPRLLRPDALLVLNDSRVFPARLRGKKDSGGAVEVLLVSPVSDRRWTCLCRSSKPLRPGGVVQFDAWGGRSIRATVRAVRDAGETELEFSCDASDLADDWIWDWANAQGETPLPPYIRRPTGEQPGDRERYQTVYANHPGSVAAPTAGLHFTRRLLERVAARGVELAYVTLHVGPGTFRPVRAERVDDHHMDGERVEVTADLAAAVRRAREAGRPVVAVGTTTVRALEGMAAEDGVLFEGTRDVSLFITPGHHFRVVDQLITNFHLPRSTLLMLVSALAGRESVLASYAHAVGSRYRFYSYGDAMLIR